MKRVCRIYDMTRGGRLVQYPLSLQHQRAIVDDIYATSRSSKGERSSSDALLLLEHSSVYTLGRLHNMFSLSVYCELTNDLI
jgi:lipoate-protein ligase B